MKMKLYKIKKNHAYLLSNGECVICTRIFSNGIKVFERRFGPTDYATIFNDYIMALNEMSLNSSKQKDEVK